MVSYDNSLEVLITDKNRDNRVVCGICMASGAVFTMPVFQVVNSHDQEAVDCNIKDQRGRSCYLVQCKNCKGVYLFDPNRVKVETFQRPA